MRLIATVLLFSAACAAADAPRVIYRSTDDSGAVSFSDRAPDDDRQVQLLHLDVPPAGSAEEHRRRMQDISASADRMAEERRARERHRAELRELAARTAAREQAPPQPQYGQAPYYVAAPRYHRPWRPPGHPGLRPPARPQPLPPTAPYAGSTALRADNAYNGQLMRPMLRGGRR